MTEVINTPAAALAKSDQNLVWLDCEMTGLSPENDRLLEIAVIVTGPNLTPRIEGPVLVIHQSDEQLGKMDAWNRGTHGRSGRYAARGTAAFHDIARPLGRCYAGGREPCIFAAQPQLHQ